MPFTPHELNRTEQKRAFYHRTVNSLSFEAFHFAMNENKN
jgi:hypothetical protein